MSGAISAYGTGEVNSNNVYSGGTITIDSGKAISNNISGAPFFDNSAFLIVKGKGQLIGNTIQDCAVVSLGNNGTATSNILADSDKKYSYFTNPGAMLYAGSSSLVEYNSLGRRTHVYTTGKANYNSITSAAYDYYIATSTLSGILVLGSGASGSYNTIYANGSFFVSRGGVATSNTISGNTSVFGQFNNNNISRGGTVDILSGGIAQSNNIDRGNLTVNSGGSASYNMINSGGSLNILTPDIGQYAFASYNTVNADGDLYVGQGGVSQFNYIQSGGSLTIGRSGQSRNDIIFSGGYAYVLKYGSVDKMTIKKGGAISVNSNDVGTTNLIVEQGGSAIISATTPGYIQLTDNTDIYLEDPSSNQANNSNAVIVIKGVDPYQSIINGAGYTSVFTEIKNFSDNAQINIHNLQTSRVTSVIYPDDDHVTFLMKDNARIVLHIDGVKNLGYTLSSDANGNVVYEVCFLTGTLISVKNGTYPVEQLKIGDTVTTYNWQKKRRAQRKIKWIGKKSIVVKQNEQEKDKAGYPVRILKDALAKNIPNKDLLIISEHCLFFKDKFIPVRMLINGTTIFYDTSITAYDYYHIETEEHSVIIADGVLTESYLDTGNRHSFNQEKKVIYTSFGKYKNWQQDGVAPLITERQIVEPIYHKIEKRAKTLGIFKSEQSSSLTTDNDFHLVTNTGVVIREKKNHNNGHVMFMIPPDVKSVWIVSRTSRPCDVIGSFVDDRRNLGLLIGDIILYDESKIFPLKSHLEIEDLEGWDIQEKTPCRWTNGRAYLPLKHKKDTNSSMILLFKVLSKQSYILDQESDNIQKII